MPQAVRDKLGKMLFEIMDEGETKTIRSATGTILGHYRNGTTYRANNSIFCEGENLSGLYYEAQSEGRV